MTQYNFDEEGNLIVEKKVIEKDQEELYAMQKELKAERQR